MSSEILKISKIFLSIFYALIITIPIIAFLQWFACDSHYIKNFVQPFSLFFGPIVTSKAIVYTIDNHFSVTDRLIGFSGTLVGLSPLILGLFLLIKIFRGYSLGNIFSIKNAIYYKYLGYLFLFDAIFAKPICQILLTLAITWSNPKGFREIQVSFNNLNLESLFCGAIIIIISRVMYIGYKIEEEQKLVI